MKYLLLIFISLAVVACDYGNKTSNLQGIPADSVLLKLQPNYGEFTEFAVRTIGNCEYIVYKNNNTLSIEHKGDCKNPIHYQVKHDTLYVVRETGIVLQKQKH